MEETKFRTQKGYDTIHEKSVTLAMEDYLEMICRYSKEHGYIRVSNLAIQLNVKMSSASKMASNLNQKGLIEYEKYGVIRPTKEGWELGDYLLYRHTILNRFFCFINHSQEELEQTEQIEHFINQKTVKNIELLLLQLESKQKSDT